MLRRAGRAGGAGSCYAAAARHARRTASASDSGAVRRSARHPERQHRLAPRRVAKRSSDRLSCTAVTRSPQQLRCRAASARRRARPPACATRAARRRRRCASRGPCASAVARQRGCGRRGRTSSMRARRHRTRSASASGAPSRARDVVEHGGAPSASGARDQSQRAKSRLERLVAARSRRGRPCRASAAPGARASTSTRAQRRDRPPAVPARGVERERRGRAARRRARAPCRAGATARAPSTSSMLDRQRVAVPAQRARADAQRRRRRGARCARPRSVIAQRLPRAAP